MSFQQADRLRIYSFLIPELSGIFAGWRGPDAATWPDDAVIRGMWIDEYLNPPTLKVRVSHDSFDPVPYGGMVPVFVCGMVDRRPADAAR